MHSVNKKLSLLLAFLFLLSACAPANQIPGKLTPAVINNATTTVSDTPSPIPSQTALTASESPSVSPDPGSTPSVESMSGEAEVELEDFAFSPATLTIKVGTTVKWSNKDTASHDVVSDSGLWSSPTLKKGDDFFFTFTQTGTFTYHCSFHSSMKGTIVVTP
jgi:plastocyanin